MQLWPFLKRRTNAEERAGKDTIIAEESSESLTIEQLLGISESNRSKALQIPAVTAAISKLANTIARLPIYLYSKTGGKTNQIENDRRTYLLSVDSGDAMDIANFWKAIIEDYYLGTGAYIYIDKFGGEYRSLRYVDCCSVTTQKNNDAIFKDFDIYVDGKRFYPFEFIKILRKTKDGAKSRSIISENNKILAVAYETLVFEHKQVKKGGNKRGFFKSARRLTGPALEELKEAANSLYNSTEGSERNIILNDGIDFKETSATSVELQLNENKVTNSDEIFSIFGFPSSIVRGGASDEDKKLFESCVVDLINCIEAALDKDLLTEEEKKTKYFAFDTRELTRGNIKDRFQAYEIALKNHFMQHDEVRKIEDLEPLGFNYITLGLADVLYDPGTEKIFVPNTGQAGNIKSLKGGDKV